MSLNLHSPDQRYALGLFHPSSVIVTHLRYPYIWSV
jgi:hypothetical protein